MNRNALITNDGKRLQTLGELIYPYGTGAGLPQAKTHEHNPNQLQTIDHPYRILIFGDSRLGKTNAFLNLIKHQARIDKNALYIKDLYLAKDQYLIF